MIVTNELTTSVKFGSDEKASISVDVKNGLLILQQLINEKRIGDHVDKADILELPKIEIEFFSVKSIDVLIQALNFIKSTPRSTNHYDPNQLAYAC